jgi:hypothetical protein
VEKKVSPSAGKPDGPYPVLFRFSSGPLPRRETFVVKILLAISPKPYWPVFSDKIPLVNESGEFTIVD